MKIYLSPRYLPKDSRRFQLHKQVVNLFVATFPFYSKVLTKAVPNELSRDSPRIANRSLSAASFHSVVYICTVRTTGARQRQLRRSGRAACRYSARLRQQCSPIIRGERERESVALARRRSHCSPVSHGCVCSPPTSCQPALLFISRTSAYRGDRSPLNASDVLMVVKVRSMRGSRVEGEVLRLGGRNLS